jgi:poly(3-hydroxybutyrate) depolymerase
MSGLLRRWTIRLVKVILVAYLVALAALFLLQRQLLFPAGKEPPSLERAGLAGLMEPVKITTADGLALLAWYHKPPNRHARLIVLFHGNGGTIEIRAAKAKTYIGAGFGVL